MLKEILHHLPKIITVIAAGAISIYLIVTNWLGLLIGGVALIVLVYVGFKWQNKISR